MKPCLLPHPQRPLRSPRQAPHLAASLSRLLGLLAVAVFLLSTAPARAQIEPTKPGKIKAANRRALREDRTTESPYKDSHLDVTRVQLKRGRSTQAVPETRKDLDYKTGTAPNVQPPGFLGLRRKKTNLQRPPAQSGNKKDGPHEKE
ncbi:hypothetical protein ACFP2F_04495 [Hymenobacter artigasi]|uniref:Uncharacterized protein n=1 Tax=Hymenobacter artigasi TaxID=2719616 RepID=A0ABX1HIR7_9BACT|nr:hypothetical protein [Hymenobacter artigasi]NKI88866.1 hypothetical protein [Hymenobacter artigasi]